MRLFLIRHGETVDNVANVYAGTRDSALTAHGVLQVRRLAAHLAQHAPATTHVFSSDLQRAVKTAEAVCRASRGDGVAVRQLSQLREKDFGSGEGARFGSGRDHDGSESVDSMSRRVDDFLDAHLLPLHAASAESVVVVAHGIILGVLFRRLCDRLAEGATTVASEARRVGTLLGGGQLLPSWSNTGYLEADLTGGELVSWSSSRLYVRGVNCVDHLQGLRKTRGGIGSARFDERQRTMDPFIVSKKRKRADATTDQRS